ncbi:lasso peptide biosynthesis B2 protein [Brevundimonas albigilva]|uniref:lasso peptide biosynthesis B2 protein n=1 Tax=Brevundimonas albigilva TaxID=1312364 RepID=UPI00201B5618|nr:lasso peptide biosynthesis B2 protein [Brevundimonas albigilva]UQV18931.1 lasso peptide biosynthesis B2 protein [Brevundimonas albigilva]
MFLRPDVHGVAVGPDAVLLDVGADAYHCLPGGGEIIASLTTIGVRAGDPGVTALADGHLLTRDPEGRSRRPLPPLPIRSIIHERPAACLLSDVAPALRALVGIQRARRRGGLLPYLRSERRHVAGDSTDSVEAARRFWTLMPYLPIEGECLVRSALLMRFLHARGLDADWVFGVRLHPFAAHCWVQSGDVCLNDDVERLTAYTPIFAAGEGCS